MATKKVDFVRRGIDYFNHHGVPDLEGLDPALEWWTPADLPDAGVRRGHREVRDHLSSWFRSFDEFRVDPQEFVDGRDYVIVRLILTGRPKDGDAPVQQNDLVQLWRFSGETVVEVREYRTMQEAQCEVTSSSERNKETWRRIIGAYNRGDKAAFLAEMHSDAATIPAPDFPEQGPFVGEAMWDFYRRIDELWGQVDPLTPSEIADLGENRLLVTAERAARGRMSDAPVAYNFYGVATFRRGRLARIEWFRQRGQALKAADLGSDE